MSVVEVTKENIKDLVEKNQMVILDFWAAWCGPCRRFGPIFESVAMKHKDIVFGKVDTEAQQELAANFEIQSIPSLAVIKEGDIIFFQPGALPEEVLEQIVEKTKEVDMAEVRKQNT
ncbi:thiol reductase thioredoxin [Bdellovibrio bacteriovorus]|uniref:Thioredoxin n=1 Tax=Bdellovibrio bacteriovorus TaxID=959 RepID=A0A150WRP0_BDEBC|nr:thioredoxin [Bdellovibrio bacteriovorus]KYG66865.1 thiol reductase thioredoxin [Bdellovibrio bacteriovorus]